MTTASVVALMADWIFAFALSFFVYALLRSNLRALLDRTIRVPDGTAFYMRVLFLVLFLSALSKVFMSKFDFKDPPHFMDYVWVVGGNLQGILDNFIWVLITYAVVVTILVVVLKPKNE